MTSDGLPLNVGQRLREARERRGIALRTIAEQTKISVRTLEALERNDIQALPGGIFSRGFMRSSATEMMAVSRIAVPTADSRSSFSTAS